MKLHGSTPWNMLGIISVLVALALVLACGSSAPDPADDKSSDQSKQDAPDKSGDKPSEKMDADQPKDDPKRSVTEIKATAEAMAPPTAKPEVADVPVMAMKPQGTINVGLKEMGPFIVHPSTMANPQIFIHSTPPLGESLLWQNLDREVVGRLAESWSISDDYLTWTFNLAKGVQFHQGYGEMKAEDVVWSMQQYAKSKHPRSGNLAEFWEDRPGSSTPDEYTVEVNTGTAIADAVAYRFMLHPGGGATYIASKKQTDELGVDEASKVLATTGSWEIVEAKTGEFWKMAAVEDHWRQTPFFAELVYREIPEESARLAGFQTGKLDTFLMNFDNIPLVEKVEGAKIMAIPNATDFRLRIYGNWYPVEGVETRPGYDPENPWVSADPDFNSQEWANAVKVRRALMMAIDREKLVRTLLSGYGNTRNPMGNYLGFVELLEGRQWEYDLEGAKQLLEEAGHGGGFSMTLTTAIRGAPAEVETCEAVGSMLRELGIDIKFQRIPYGTLRPTLVARTYQGATCHAGSGYLTPAYGYGSYLSKNKFNRGLEHQWTEDRMLKAMSEVDTEKRRALETEIGQFIFDNALTDLNILTMDAVWPVGPRLEPWSRTDTIGSNDMRQMSGFEHIQHRK